MTSSGLPFRESIPLTVRQLEKALELAKRAHDGSVQVDQTEINGLDWVRIDVLLTDMGDVPPLHVFFLDPTGRLRNREALEGSADA